MRRMNNLVTLFSAIFAFFFGTFLTTLMTDVEKCPTKSVSKIEQKHDMFLIVLILSSPNYFERRQVIRKTWLKLGRPLTQSLYPWDFLYLPDYDEAGFLKLETIEEQISRHRMNADWMNRMEEAGDGASSRNVKVKHYFAVGTNKLKTSWKEELQRENDEYHDLLFLPDLVDSYSNLTLKLIASIKELMHRETFRYLLKVDDDTYVKFDYLLNELVSFNRKLAQKAPHYKEDPLPELYWGYFDGRASVKKKGQWKEDHYYLCSRYVSYALGGGYVISRFIAEYIDMNSHLLNTYASEDVSVGTWLAPLRNIYRRHDVRFDTGYIPRNCNRIHMVLHKRSMREMKDLYDGEHCKSEPSVGNTNRPLEYYYDWTKPADACCTSLAN